MRMNLDHIASHHFVLGRDGLCLFNYWPLTVLHLSMLYPTPPSAGQVGHGWGFDGRIIEMSNPRDTIQNQFQRCTRYTAAIFICTSTVQIFHSRAEVMYLNLPSLSHPAPHWGEWGITLIQVCLQQRYAHSVKLLYL